ncbi:hypothetical protein [Streptomyces hainanensis]|uniref:Integral membrane protein n=1 Tax=Streptomyces hainanensis TaxID=402648 RepID=A0A4R4TCB6_9ACTN|nr:hypothetical protein [Streptomyces hainanensis]TDC71939.1 hypothetical protein E1283_22900 [Streptomyces hainanensis]
MTSASDRDLNHDADLRGDLEAAVQTRKELGESYEAELIDSFLGKVEQRIDATVDKRVRRQLAEQQMVVARGGRPSAGPQAESQGPGVAFGLAALSLVLAIPLSAIAAAQGGVSGLLLCWAGIVGVNACYVAQVALRRDEHKRPRDDDWD